MHKVPAELAVSNMFLRNTLGLFKLHAGGRLPPSRPASPEGRRSLSAPREPRRGREGGVCAQGVLVLPQHRWRGRVGQLRDQDALVEVSPVRSEHRRGRQRAPQGAGYDSGGQFAIVAQSRIPRCMRLVVCACVHVAIQAPRCI